MFNLISFISFNSIKVRLNQVSDHIAAIGITFQFHKGTIKPFTQLQTKLQGMLFQFHKGTIKPLGMQPLFAYEMKFQFHKGTIKPPSPTPSPTTTPVSIP